MSFKCFLLFQNKPAYNVRRDIREIHQKEIQIWTARQASDVQQKSVIHHTDDHPAETMSKRKTYA